MEFELAVGRRMCGRPLAAAGGSGRAWANQSMGRPAGWPHSDGEITRRGAKLARV